MNHDRTRHFALMLIAGMLLVLAGCGTVQEGTYEDDWTSAPPVSVTARLEYRIDSLMNENRRLRQQMEALQTENTNLNERLTELQTRPAAAPPPASTPAPEKSASPAPPPTASSTAAYQEALKLYRTRDFSSAIDRFNGLLQGGISEKLADNCHYWIGESYFGQKKYNEAIQAFNTVVGIDGSDKGDDAYLMLGNSYAALGNKSAAKDALQKLMTLYPKSPLAKRAKAKMDSL